MALITCPNCGRKGISTKAYYCVGCRCPMEKINRMLDEINEKNNAKPVADQKVQVKPITTIPPVSSPIRSKQAHNETEKCEPKNREFDETEKTESALKGMAPNYNYVNLGDYYSSNIDDDSYRDAEDYLSEYRDCLDGMNDDGWFYPD